MPVHTIHNMHISQPLQHNNQTLVRKDYEILSIGNQQLYSYLVTEKFIFKPLPEIELNKEQKCVIDNLWIKWQKP